MFDFLFKRRSAGTASSNRTDAAKTAETAAAAAAQDRSKARQEARAEATRQAAALRDETEALAFIAQCEFADARLQAAQWLHGAAALNEALRAVRNSDRRVAKLLQTRLDEVQRRERTQIRMREVLEQAEALTRDPSLTPDRVAEIDRAWSGAGAVDREDAAVLAQFAQLRDVLDARLAAQTQLQRSLIDTRRQLQTIKDTLQIELQSESGLQPGLLPELQAELQPGPAIESSGDAGVLAVAAALDRLQAQIAQDRTASEAAALPKQLLPDCEHLLDVCRAAQTRLIADAQTNLLRRQAEAAAASAEAESVPVREIPAISPARQQPKSTVLSPTEKAARLSQWQDWLAQLEAALEQGALQGASEAERALRDIDLRAIKPDAAEISRLNAAYAALHHLQGWARWGGNISREELWQAALALPQQGLPIPELVQKIGGLRARWKLLSVSAGPAPQSLWLQFDAACNAAYAPAAALFEQQDKERQENRAAAAALIEEAVLFAQQQETTLTALALDNAAEDSAASDGAAHPAWRQLAQFDTRMRQAWQRLGPLGHKEKRVLERAFNAALNAVQAPLRVRQKIEIGARKMLISEVAALSAQDRSALDALRRIQADWQQRAQSMPLPRKDEQALWQAFRTACDDIFAQRKETAATQDAQRQLQLQDKEAVCAQLEALFAGNEGAEAGPQSDAGVLQDALPDALRNTLQQAQAAWSRIGPAPRAAERAIEQRYRQAVAAIQRRMRVAQDKAAAAAMAAETAQIDAHLTLCFALEASLSRGALTAADADAWRSRWEAAQNTTPALPPALGQVLQERFEAALAAIASDFDGAAYLQQLQAQRAQFDDALLEAEIALGLDSPPELARLRMQLQVALLQSSLKAGAPVLSGRQHLARLCALPALADQPTLARIGDIVRRALKQESSKH